MTLLLPVYLVYGIIIISLAYADNSVKDASPFASFTFTLIRLLLSTVFALGIRNVALKIYRGESVSLDDFFKHTHYFLAYLYGAILYALVVIGGFFLLLIPGIIWALRFQFYGYFIVDKGLKTIPALKESLRITKDRKNLGYLFRLAILLVVFNILGIVTILGMLFTFPATALALAYAYKALSGDSGSLDVPAVSGAPLVP